MQVRGCSAGSPTMHSQLVTCWAVWPQLAASLSRSNPAAGSCDVRSHYWHVVDGMMSVLHRQGEADAALSAAPGAARPGASAVRKKTAALPVSEFLDRCALTALASHWAEAAWQKSPPQCP